MSPAFSIALLLLSATVVESWKGLDQTEEEKGFPLQLNQYVREKAENPEEEEGPFPGSCTVCKAIVTKVKKILGKDSSKKRIEEELNKVCNVLKPRFLVSACKTVIRKYKGKIIDSIANRGNPRTVCLKMKLCKTNAPVFRYYK